MENACILRSIEHNLGTLPWHKYDVRLCTDQPSMRRSSFRWHSRSFFKKPAVPGKEPFVIYLFVHLIDFLFVHIVYYCTIFCISNEAFVFPATEICFCILRYPVTNRTAEAERGFDMRALLEKATGPLCPSTSRRPELDVCRG